MTENELREQYRKKFSAFLMDTSEENLYLFGHMVSIGEDQGLSSLDLPAVDGAFQMPGDGTIYFTVYGALEPIEFDDLKLEDIRCIDEEIFDI